MIATTPMGEHVTASRFKARVIEFASRASLEVTPHDEDRLPGLVDHLTPGTSVYIAHPPRRVLRDVVRIAVKAQNLGLRAHPHILARELESEAQLRSALSELNAAGIEQILLVAGDQSSVAGPFSSTLEVLATGVTVKCGIKTIAVAGHPEGHKLVGPSLLWDALRAKQKFAESTGTRIEVVTQFGFNAQAIFDWQQHAQALGISLPAHVGLAAPTPLPRLIHFAMLCGIGASLRSLVKSTSALTNLARVTTTPEEMLTGLVLRMGETPAEGIVKPHFFCFGGSLEAARWLRAVIDGRFDLAEDGSRFIVRPG